MPGVPTLASLERELETARAQVEGTQAELSSLVELTARLVRDPHRRGALARDGVALATRLGDEVARLRCCAMVAEFVARCEQPTRGLSDALETVAEADRHGHPLAIAQAHHTVAMCFHLLDCVPESLEHDQTAITNYRRSGDTFGEGRALSLMAALFADLGENDQAKAMYRQAHDVFLDCDDPSGAGVMMSNLASHQNDDRDPVSAEASCQRAMQFFEQAGLPLDSVIAMRVYAETLGALGQHELAELWIKRASERNRLPDGRLANPGYEIDILLAAAKAVQVPCGDLAGARATVTRAVELADEQGALRMSAEAEAELAKILRASGDLEAAFDHLDRSRVLTDECARAVHDQRVRALRVRFDIEEAQWEARRYREQNRAQAAIISELERTKAELDDRMAELQRLNAEVVLLSQTDPLTGIANRRYMTDRLDELTRGTARYGTPLSVAVFDIDRFKHINDRYGHQTGDRVLKTVTELVRRYLRASDLPARLGGDEFVVIMPGATGAEAAVAGRRLVRAVQEYAWDEIAAGLTVTITVGIADGTGCAEPDEILRRADSALYRGKRAGRNNVTS